jgi:hypothetical protein
MSDLDTADLMERTGSMKVYVEPVTINMPAAPFSQKAWQDAILAHAKEVAGSMNRRLGEILRDAFDVDEGGWPLRGE